MRSGCAGRRYDHGDASRSSSSHRLCRDRHPGVPAGGDRCVRGAAVRARGRARFTRVAGRDGVVAVAPRPPRTSRRTGRAPDPSRAGACGLVCVRLDSVARLLHGGWRACDRRCGHLIVAPRLEHPSRVQRGDRPGRSVSRSRIRSPQRRVAAPAIDAAAPACRCSPRTADLIPPPRGVSYVGGVR